MGALKQGETGCVKQGSYTASNLRPAATGTSAKPIALKADGSVTVTISPADDFPTFDFSSAQQLGYWLLEGFTIDKAGHDGPAIMFLGGAQGRVQSMAVRKFKIRDGRAPMAVQIRGQAKDILVQETEISGFKRWKQGNNSSFHWQQGFGRDDANAISIEADLSPGAARDKSSVERVLIQKNFFHDNGGDGVQCQGGENEAPTMPLALDPADIDIVDNRVVNTPGSEAVEENAYDIKSCQRVAIRGSDPPLPNVPGAQFNKVGEFLPTVIARDLGSNNSNNSDGTGIVLHYQARSILIDNIRMWDVCAGISIGRADTTARNVVIRRTLIFGLRYHETPPSGSTADADRCRSRGIVVTNAIGVKIYHSTIDGFVDRGVMVEREKTNDPYSSDVDIFNNIFSARRDPTPSSPRKQWFIGLHVDPAKLSNPAVLPIGINYNVFWHPDRDPKQPHFLLNNADLPLARWQDNGFDTPNSKYDDPKFPANPRQGDYVTAAGSPARDTALKTTANPAAYCGSGPDIGFRESCT